MAAIHYPEVPESLKAPWGPYHQAPSEFGGEWWLVSPFTSTQPWLTQLNVGVDPNLPPGFEDVFGPPPKYADFAKLPGSQYLFRIARDKYQQDKRYFVQVGSPPVHNGAQPELAAGVFSAWGMGEVVWYEGRYGWRARFPKSAINDFEVSADTAAMFPHQVVSGYQMRSIERGIIPAVRHPYVPPHIWPQTPAAEVKREVAAIESEINALLAPKEIPAASKKAGDARRRLSKN